jgi:hypothetical protein
METSKSEAVRNGQRRTQSKLNTRTEKSLWAYAAAATAAGVGMLAYPGQETETDNLSEVSSGASVLPASKPVAARPASLGMLALGADGLSAWRREEDSHIDRSLQPAL